MFASRFDINSTTHRLIFRTPAWGLAIVALLALIGLPGESSGQASFKRGDLDGDGCVGSSDFALFKTGFINGFPTPGATCLDAWDIDDDGDPTIDVFDFLGLRILLSNGTTPACTTDPTPDAITCVSYAGCADECDNSACVPIDNGTGTIDLPPEGGSCDYLTPGEVHMIIDGLDPGTVVNVDVIHGGFTTITRTSGGVLGGEIEQFNSTVQLVMVGTGSLEGFNRTIEVTAPTEIHTESRTPGLPIQFFETDLRSLQGQITGDPDFQSLTITAGSANGLSSPGGTTLNQVAGGYDVDSYFNVTYQIDFVGAPGSALDGLTSTSGSQTLMGLPTVTAVPAFSRRSFAILIAVMFLAAGVALARRRRSPIP